MNNVSPIRSISIKTGTPPTDITAAAEKLANAIETESVVHAERIKAEQEVLALAGELPDEGTTRIEAGAWQVVIKTSVNRKVDSDKLIEIAGKIPEAIGKRLIRWKPELVTREVRYVEDNEPEIYFALADAMTAKPAKPSVKLEPAKQAA